MAILPMSYGQAEGSVLTAAVVGFLVGFLSTVVIDYLRRRREKLDLIELFISEIDRNWEQADMLKTFPGPKYLSRSLYSLKGVEDVHFTTEPELELEVYNKKLFETEGLRLVQLVRSSIRRRFWEAYGILRDAEELRALIGRLPADHPDMEQYRKVFAELSRRLGEELLGFRKALLTERPWYRWS